MRPSTLTGLGLGERLDSVVGTALLARAAAMQVRRSEGPSARMQDLAALSLGTMALLDVEVTGRAASGLALTFSDVPSALPAIAAGIAAATGSARTASGFFLAEADALPAVPVDWAVFSILQELLWEPHRPRRRYPGGIAAAIGRDDGQPIGRLGISAYRWMRLAEVRTRPDRAAAALWILERGADEVEQAMRDSFHWQSLHAGLAPLEPELLLAGLILLGAASQRSSPAVDVPSANRPVVRATLAVAAGMLGQARLAEDLGGPAAEIGGQPGRRWRRWQASAGEGTLVW
jgi:hypothetical protein